MTSWLRRLHGEEPPAPPPPEEDPADRPEALLWRQWEVVRTVNRSAGRLPAEAVVVARRVLDAVRQVIETGHDRELDVHAVILVRGILDDYLPTTLNTYLALDPDVVDRPAATGRTPADSLIDQLYTLEESALDLLRATRSRDVDALLSQGNFLSTKFSRSDLDI